MVEHKYQEEKFDLDLVSNEGPYKKFVGRNNNGIDAVFEEVQQMAACGIT